MEQTSSFQDLFNAALKDYENQTKTSLVDHPLINRLKLCDSVNSITAILQEHAQIFHEFRGDDGKLMKSLKCSVSILYPLSISTAGISLVHSIIQSYFFFSNCHSTAIPACECSIRWYRNPTCRMSIIRSHLFICVKSKPRRR